MAGQFDAVAELTASFKLLFQRNNWMLAIPVLVGSIVGVLVLGVCLAIGFGSAIFSLIGAGAMTAGSSSGNIPTGMGALMGAIFGFGGLMLIIGVILCAVVITVGYAWTYAAGEPVWKGGAPDIGGGFSKALAKFGPLFVAALIIGLVLSLTFWTFIVPIAIGLFCLFVIPYIMQANESGWGSISASIKLVSSNFGPAGMLFLGLIVVAVASAIINMILGIIPILGHLVALAVNALLAAFTLLAIMRFYALLTGAAAPSAPAATPTT